MKLKSIYAILLLAVLTSCGGSIEGVDLGLAEVEPGTFTLGATPDKRFIKGSETQRQLIMPGYEISVKPVSEKLWNAVMKGKNEGSDEVPVTMVSYKDCQKFVAKLSSLSGKEFVIPTEAMWEFAQKSKALSLINGSMEWTSEVYENTVKDMVVRNASERVQLPDYTKSGTVVFRVACLNGKECPQNIVDAMDGKQTEREHVCSSETIVVNGASFNMLPVKGGLAVKGATTEQGDYAEEDEKPVTFADIEDFELAQTEVTVAQWMAVMEVLPAGNDRNEANKPVINVSWYAAQEYILKLNALTGRIFRLPTETEWEYAARGGSKSGHYRYSGSNQVGAVAIYADNSKNLRVEDVKGMGRNELGFYDMSGNAWEWCLDSYGPYGDTVEPGNTKVMRGGSAASKWDGCRVSNRSAIPADNIKATFGFRLAI